VLGGVLVIVLIVCVVLGGLFSAGAKTIKDQQQAANKDVSLAQCDLVSFLGGEAGHAVVLIHNHGSTSANYLITVAFESSDGAIQYDTAIATANNLAPGQETSQEAQGLTKIAAASMKCHVTDVTRF
jgi:hypothetical protein